MRKFPRVNAQVSKLGPIQPWDVKDFLRPGRGARFLSTVFEEALRELRLVGWGDGGTL